ncbi:hypothetical protein HDU93_009890, partial [Gonapodya sp. JEL0774]
MLNPKALAQVLSLANSGGVEAAILFTTDGSPVSAAIHPHPTLPLLVNPSAFPSSSPLSPTSSTDLVQPSSTPHVPPRIAHLRASKNLSAILSNVWYLYEKNARLVDDSVSRGPESSTDKKREGLTGELRTVFVEVEGGKVVVGRTGGGMVVGMVAGSEVGWGMVRMK